MKVLVTGGAGYVGAELVDELLEAGHEVRALDVLLHGQDDVAAAPRRAGRRAPASATCATPDARERALDGVDAVVHLAAIVGDPACGRDPELSNAVNVEGTRALVADARAAGVERFVFASTCSNYGRMADPTVPIDETGELAPVSLYAEQKVAMEKSLLEGERTAWPPPACASPPSTASGHRMRFDLTVNEFTRDLWADRKLDVFGETFWRPYVHVRDAARAVALVLASPPGQGLRARVQRRPLGRELPQARPGRDDHRAPRPRRRRVRHPHRGPARLQGLLRADPERARLRAGAARARRASTSWSARSRRSASATRSRPATRTSADERRPPDPAVRRQARAATTSTRSRTRCARAG